MSTQEETIDIPATNGNKPNGAHAEIEVLGPRRSHRARKPRTLSLSQNDEDELTTAPPSVKATESKTKQAARRNPSRKAAATPSHEYNLPDDLLEQTVAAITDAERVDWQGWVELESEPSFFNVILQELGVKDVKIQELFSVDEDSLGFLPKPVFGLIFLYQYIDEESSEARPDCPDNVWFANQTTDNACATIALLNIIMNCEGLELGQRLQEFKQSTQCLSPPLRGHALSVNTFIRSIHNSFARRLDLLNADLALQNTFDESKKKKRRAGGGRGKKKPQSDAAFHFIAYVPVGGQVWELDGLETKPVCLGSYDGDWTTVARPIVEARMLQYEGENLSFNLLALCRSPLDGLRQELAVNIRKLQALQQHVAQKPEWTSLTNGERTWTSADDDASLAEFGMLKSSVQQARLEKNFSERISQASFEVSEALALQQSLENEQRRIKSEYNAELVSMDEDHGRVLGRKKDYTPAIHDWIRKLAEHDILQELVDSMAA